MFRMSAEFSAFCGAVTQEVRDFPRMLPGAVLAAQSGIGGGSPMLFRALVMGAHVIGAIIFCSLVAVVAWHAIEWLHPHTANEALLIGDEWVLLSIGFQVLAGYVLVGTQWHRWLMEYNVTQGQQWELVLVTMFAMPAVAALRRHLVAPPFAHSRRRRA
jgi:hypothetical protein